MTKITFFMCGSHDELVLLENSSMTFEEANPHVIGREQKSGECLPLLSNLKPSGFLRSAGAGKERFPRRSDC